MTGTNPKRGATSNKDGNMPENMRKTPHGYNYLKTVPKDLRQALGKTVIKKSLSPKYAIAKAQCATLEAETTELFQRLRQSAQNQVATDDAIEAYRKKPRSSRLKPLDAGSQGLAAQLSLLHMAGLRFESEERADAERWMSPDENSSFTLEIQQVLELTREAVASGDVSAFFPVVEQLAEFRGYRLVDHTGNDMQRLTYEFLRAAQQACKVLLARQQGDFADANLPEVEPLPAVWENGVTPSHLKDKKSRLSDVTSLYAKRLSTVGTKTQNTNISWWEKLVLHCRDKSLDEVTSNDIYSFLEQRLNDVVKPWSMKYESKVISGLRLAFSIAQAEGLCRHNPAVELRLMPAISAVEEKKRRKPRKRYSLDQLNTIFSSAWYDSSASNWQGRMKWDLGARYWVPLLGLYHGFRVREALQLKVTDVVLGRCPLVTLQVDDSDEDENAKDVALPKRSLKNEATKRTIPIHPQLIALGFVEFVKSAIAEYGPSAPLFPSSLPESSSKEPKWGRAYEQRYVPFVRDVLGFGSGFGNHSFRHTLEDQLRAAQLSKLWPPGLGQFYTGRTLPSDHDRGFFLSVGSESDYGDGYDPTRIVSFVKRIQYKGLELPKPFVEWLGNKPPLARELMVLLDKDWGRKWREGV